jgi:hypothetical protein
MVVARAQAWAAGSPLDLVESGRRLLEEDDAWLADARHRQDAPTTRLLAADRSSQRSAVSNQQAELTADG